MRFWSLMQFFKRSRPIPERDEESNPSISDSSVMGGTSTISHLADQLLKLRYRFTTTHQSGDVVCRFVRDDAATQRSYGCHAHVYETVSPDSSHGTALVWRLDPTSPLSSLSLLSLCRVANTCRKSVLLATPNEEALLLTYTDTI